MSETVAHAVSERLIALAAEMRRRGGRPGPAHVLLAHRALLTIDPSSQGAVRDVLSSVLCAGYDDLARFDAAFAAVFAAPPADAVAPPEVPARPRVRELVASDLPEPDVEPGSDRLRAASALERLRHKDFSAYTEEELLTARRLLTRLAAGTPVRPSLRLRPAARSRGARPDLRRTLRDSQRTDGVRTSLRFQRPGVRPRRVVLICDASGSMEPYARVLLQLLGSWVRAGRSAEAFVFATRLTRLTAELCRSGAGEALERAHAKTDDWGAGTLIGASLSQLNREHGCRLGKGSIAVIASDGWDRGDPEVLEAEVKRLRRSVHALIWLNPHAADPEFRPVTRGMQTVIPSTDLLLAGNCLASLEQLVELLASDPRFGAS